MFPSVLLALPLLLPPLEQEPVGPRVDVISEVPSVPVIEPSTPPTLIDRGAAVIPPLYAREDGKLSLVILPSSLCTAACLRLQGTF